MPQTPAALLFDMDGLLLDTERLAQRAFLEVMDEADQPRAVTEPLFLTLVGGSDATTRAAVGAAIPELDLDEMGAKWSDRFADIVSDGIPLRPRVGEALERASGHGLPMAVVTSSHGHRARHHLAIAGIDGHFQSVTGGDEVSAPKPDPAPYVETAARLGVDPQDCAAFEDSDRGATAATAAGCQLVQIPDLRPTGLSLPDLGQLHAPDLWEALDLLGL